MGLIGRNHLTNCRILFVTTTVIDHLNVFSDEKACQILVNNIIYYKEKYNFKVLAYAIMPSHFHWIVEINPEYGKITDIMRDIKKYSAWELMEYISLKNPELLRQFQKASSAVSDKQSRKFWMPRFDDEVIRNEKMFWTKLHYINDNPVKAGLVINPEDYKYSSARNYINGDNSILEVDTSYTGFEMK